MLKKLSKLWSQNQLLLNFFRWVIDRKKQICDRFLDFWTKMSGSTIWILETSCKFSLSAIKNSSSSKKMNLNSHETLFLRKLRLLVWATFVFQLKCDSYSKARTLTQLNKMLSNPNSGMLKVLKWFVNFCPQNALCWTIF